jgi:hypothetical protein
MYSQNSGFRHEAALARMGDISPAIPRNIANPNPAESQPCEEEQWFAWQVGER